MHRPVLDAEAADEQGGPDGDPGQLGTLHPLFQNPKCTGQFWTLKQLTDKVGLTETLSTGGPFTVFAPTNAAFAEANVKADDNKLPEEILKKVRSRLLYNHM
jgi:uncharacterized surface protein with fasciclin (FAS1) repeats